MVSPHARRFWPAIVAALALLALSGCVYTPYGPALATAYPAAYPYPYASPPYFAYSAYPVGGFGGWGWGWPFFGGWGGGCCYGGYGHDWHGGGQWHGGGSWHGGGGWHH